ncbi:SGNH/GDSL hydrolase family protein [Candidatus Enterococcus mansonii]|uniref:SGNH hydrolase-type esterase domain-containing protein n=1 Tax=Candidatus Enterococcus mansonii TaxID=1834181 RepID=A0A242C6P3_9ENTE|nr:SGNH/GDSL hydrolase family protein [Enterococcus sp. 4G2_DIV0659]OTO05846.1 hypothetical protein A5880_003021 [Enterococcus sp. 4G2_DIV0659]
MHKSVYIFLGALIPIIVLSVYYLFLPKETTQEVPETQQTIYSSERLDRLNQIVYSPMGDSISAGWITEKEEQKFPSILSSIIAEAYDIQVKEKGIYEAGARASNLGISSVDNIIKQQPNLVTIEYGTNDLLDYKDEQSLKQFEANLSYIVSELKEQNIFVVLVTTWNRDKDRSQLYDDVIFKVGSKYDIPVANIRGLWTNRKDTIDPKSADNFLKNKNIKNDMHPNEKGHEEIAKRIFESIEPRWTDYLSKLK